MKYFRYDAEAAEYSGVLECGFTDARSEIWDALEQGASVEVVYPDGTGVVFNPEMTVVEDDDSVVEDVEDDEWV